MVVGEVVLVGASVVLCIVVLTVVGSGAGGGGGDGGCGAGGKYELCSGGGSSPHGSSWILNLAVI